MSINRVNISGNLTREPELRSTQSGTAVLTFGIAVNDRKKDPSSGEWIDVPNFFDCTVFGKRADSLSRILHKGMKVAIEGKLRWSSYQDKNGQKRSKVEIIVEDVVFMSGQSDSKAQNGQQSQQPSNYTNQGGYGANSGSQQPTGGYYDDMYSEPIPF